MINLLKLSLVLLALSSCCEKYKNKYVISTKQYLSEISYKTKEKQDLEPVLFYGNFNFVLDSSNKVYFYSNKIVLGCGYDDLSKPKFINLKPSEIRTIDTDSLDYFLASLKLNTKYSSEMVISSLSDTIYCRELDFILDYIGKQKTNLVYQIRERTEEESIVLQHLKQNKPYNSDLVDWKETRGYHKTSKSRDKDTLPVTVLP